ncbi:MAG TPA: peptidoglycan-associated lipoprotein Pal [Burkholderiales bacterium]|nr:peptidoglycan-associated lipoprotein Pal [Burkholderiales bacterium]
MKHDFAMDVARVAVAACVAGMLGACATTQKSSSGMGMTDDAAAPAKATAAAPPAAPASAASAQPEPAPPVKAQATESSDMKEDTPARSAGNDSTASPTTISSQEIEAEKRALATEEANINKLRAGQETDKQGIEADSAAPPATATAASSTSATQAAPEATQSSPPRTASKGPDDAQLVFPENGGASNRDEAGNRQAAGDEPKNPLQRSVYFDFDKSIIKEQYDPMLKAQAAWLESHKSTPAEIQGNCDERGSREYNLALGARRAEAVKQALELLGVDGAHIKTVSFGSEKPIALGKDEESYSQNRRADILH